MFIREKKSKNKSTSVQIVENNRMGNTTKQQVLRHIGTAKTEEEIDQLKRLAAIVKSQLENETISKQSKSKIAKAGSIAGDINLLTCPTLVDINKLKEIKRQILGIHDIYGHLYNRLGFTNLFSRPQQREEAAKILREIVLARIACPVSKRASVALLEEKFDVLLDLDQVYRMMDKMDESFYERVKQQALIETQKLTGEKLRILFYDATTLYFESFLEDELRQNGYSKDMKFNQPQVLLALWVTEKGMPIGYELFPGSTFEGHTLLTTLEKLKAQYKLEDVIFIADRGLFSEENLRLLEENNFKYIVGARIKNLSKKMQETIFDEKNYQRCEIKFKTKKKRKKVVEQRIGVFEIKSHPEQRLVIHYDSLRAQKDEYDRIKSIDKLRKKLLKSKDPKALLNNYGYKKYLDVEGDATLGINETKIEAASRWDGLLGITTNVTDMAAEFLLTHYRGLWQIEESFRINKHDLRMRPIFHWSPHRVKAHIAISFMAFVCVRHLEYILAIRSQKISPEIIRKALLQVQASTLKDNSSGRHFLLTSHIPEEAKKIYKIMGIKTPPQTAEICGASAKK